MTDETSVMFEIGVMEHPATKARLDSLTRQVIEAQAKMTQGVERIGAVATTVSQSVTPLLAQIKAYRESSVGAIDDVRGAIIRLHALAEKRVEQVIQVVVKGAEAAEMGQAKPMDIDIRLPDDLEQKFNRVGAQIEGLRQDAADSIRVNIDVPSNLKNVFKELGDVSVEEANRIESAFNESISKLPQSVAANTALIKQEYAKRVASQAEAYGKMATDLDSAIEKQGDATERINANIVKATKSVVGAAKGFAQLGMLSAESSKAMLDGIVAIEGVVNILDGGVDLLEAFSGGWKGVRQSTDAANKVAQIQQAMMGPQFASMKAYQAQLIQETASANAAALANGRLNASRGVKGASVVGVGSQAVGSAAQSIGSAVTSQAVGAGATRAVSGAAAAGGGAFLSTNVAGVATGLLGSIAAAGAALAAVSLVAVELSETFSGTAGKVGSVTDTIASGEASFAAGALRMTGLFERLDSPATKLAQSLTNTVDSFIESIPGLGRFKDQLNFASGAIGDFAGLAASTAAVERAEKRLATDKRSRERQDALSGAEQQARSSIGQSEFKTFSQTTRMTAEATGSVDSRLGAELQIQAQAAQELAKYQREAANSAESQGRTSKQYLSAIGQVKSFQDAITGSMDKQRSLVSEQSRIQLDAQSKIQDGLKKQLEMQDTGLEKLKTGYRSAVGNFSKLGTIEKQQALDALSQARKKGGGSLDDGQKDLLRSVGTEEANKFADQGDLAEAKQFGFSDKNFGSGFDQQRKQLESVRQTLQAELKTTYAVQVKVETDKNQIVREIVSQSNQVATAQNAEIMKQVQEEFQAQKRQINDQFRQVNGNRR